jgi:hypothetical protein
VPERNEYISNPKLVGSGIWACFPQGKPCPLGCNQCFAHQPGCYAPFDRPNIPDPTRVGDDVVRISDIGDSNIDRDAVLRVALRFRHPYFNTSIPRLDFPGPTVLTVNPKELGPKTWTFPDKLDASFDNLMAVRVRLCQANVADAAMLIGAWALVGVPVLVMTMRYYSLTALDAMLAKSPVYFGRSDYTCHKHILNESWQPTDAATHRMGAAVGMGRLPSVYWCAGPLCKDCRQCLSLFWLCRRRLELIQRMKGTKL